MTGSISQRLAIDIGGTFTDVVLEQDGELNTSKVLTTPAAPEDGVLNGIEEVLAKAGTAPGDIGMLLHGTTLATNAIIERKGANVALITTDGFRDVLEIGYESRFNQYDIFIDKPMPLVPRHRRFTVPERVDVHGRVLLDLDEDAVKALLPELDRAGVESIAIGFLHGYANPAHEQRAREIIEAARPDLSITLSSEVCPEIREFERLTTATANAYVRPLIARYLNNLETRLSKIGIVSPVLLMTSGGGLTTLETAARFPIRLVESGPAGGAILATGIAADLDLTKAISFDMGGTTAKICLIDDFAAQRAREFEVDRQARFRKGSGLPLRIPVIEMVEVGAGGGSIARVDALNQITIGPDSAGADPGPAAYGRGGEQPTITDADIHLGRIDPGRFAGGQVPLSPDRAEAVLSADIGKKLDLSSQMAAYGVTEMVDETMANAARVHAVEQGKEASDYTLIAFGGAAPLHAGRLAEKLSVERIIVPTHAGVGSAVGFLRAPVAYEVVRSRNMRLRQYDPEFINAIFHEMYDEAKAVVEAGAPGSAVSEHRLAYMRYLGQGHEIAVKLPARPLTDDDADLVQASFDATYERFYQRTLPNAEVEVLTWALTLTTASAPSETTSIEPADSRDAQVAGSRAIFDPASGQIRDVPLHWRPDLVPGDAITGPAVIAENETSTFVPKNFDARIAANGFIIVELNRERTS
ncbi:MAG: hydantoinase/oxoprolinase family protein [Alphaproteobacteria bacterium]|nr:hydantoinase/oxoprolinase family protein [Alphaproteobacteria bacterium]